MSKTNRNDRRAVVWSAGSVCAAWLIAAAGAGQAMAQDRNPFGKPASSSGNAEITVTEYMTVDLHVQDEDLANVLQMLSLQSQRNIVVSNDVSATVSANLYNVTFYEALDAILNVNGYGYIERGNFIFVYTLEEIKQIEQAARKPVSKVVTLNYLNANDAAEFVSPLLSEVGQIKTNGDTDSFTIPDNAPVGAESFALTSTLVIVDYPEHIDEIEKLIVQLDTRPAQVLVEATILQTALNEANAFGIDFSIIGDVSFTDFMGTGGPLSAANALLGGEDGVTPDDNRAIAGTGTAGNTRGPSTFKLGVIQDDFAVFLRLLDEVTDTTILSRPKLLTLNRQPARVLVGERVGYLNTTSTETSTTQTVEFLDTGTQLSFRPFISTDGMIRMELRPSVSEGVIRQAADSTGANVSIPDEITQELNTNVMVRDGSTIVLGGLFKETTTLTRRQVPFVGDIPLIGAAFRGHEDATDRSEIIFMVTPTIVNDDMLIEDGERAIAYAERVRAGTRSGLLPWSRDRMTAVLNVEAEKLALEGNSQEALWKVRRSLELNPNQPEAIFLRERLLHERELWPSRSILDRILDDRIDAEFKDVEPVAVTTDVMGLHYVALPIGRGMPGNPTGEPIPARAEASDGPTASAYEFVGPPEANFSHAQTVARDDSAPAIPMRPQLTSKSQSTPAIRRPEDLDLTVTITPHEQFVDDPFSAFEAGAELTQAPDWALPFLNGDPALFVMQEPDPVAPDFEYRNGLAGLPRFTGVWRALKGYMTTPDPIESNSALTNVPEESSRELPDY